MKETTAAGSIPAKSQLANYYRWTEPDSDITVCLRLDTAERLQMEALRGVTSFSRVKNEVGGILLGRTEVDEGRIFLLVDDFEPIPCEHRNGPFYALTGGDAANFNRTMARSSAGQTRSVVGYFRSHNRDGLFLSADDLRIIRRHFREPDNVFLLIKTLPSRACTAGFFFWKDGQIQSEFTSSEVPLIPISGFAETRADGVVETVNDAPVEPAATVLPVDDERSYVVRSRDFQHWLIRGLALACGAAALIYASGHYRKPATDAAPGASAAHHGKDGTVIPVANAGYAKPAPIPVRGPAPGVAPPSAGVAIPAQGLPKMAISQISSPTVTPGGNETTRANSVPPSETAAVRAPVPVESGPPPPSSPPPSSRPVTPPAEGPPNTTAPSPVGTIVASQAQVTPLPPAPANPVSPPVEVPRTDASAPVTPVPTPAPPSPSATPTVRTFIGPQVIHQVTPAVPRGVGPKITTDAQVDVAVAIDANGKVTGARVASTKGAAAGLLTIEALKAAQLFRFQPARENNHNVASSMVLTFRFARTTK